ncbi:methylamine dehydrogenase (amicyanin) light chain [Sphingobium sp. Leaf26]|uniref:methylamine dehydrogenase light chain n=1 Tax=Sphingobium sp. Leaf26 TaxID=1735693 RepID=UPI0006FE5939|nr:methylamine dehydrogenase light chain [Sphingobium sp. Leaf26]KQN04684.1 methylamine dehydrogenase (amicyanin) light chain [Sphingobium sp. Leaf26]
MAGFDTFTERMARGVARGTSRRSLLAWLGAGMTGTAMLPALPVARAATHPDAARPEMKSGTPQDPGNPASCDYWRYCAIDGFLCSCCGGTVNSCPPGTEMSPITWIGTCTNPADGRAYIISYNDCCGVSSCGQCLCNRNEGDRPQVRPQSNNDYNWCLGTESSIYNCSVAAIVGTALDQPQ